MSITLQPASAASRRFCPGESIRWFARERGVQVFWGLMAGAHMPALATCLDKLASSGSPSSIESLILLTASMTFFLLKVADVRFLRFRVTRRSGVALCVLVAFMHFDAIGSGDDATLVPTCAMLIASTIVVSRSLCIRRDLVATGSHEHQTNTLLSRQLLTTRTVWTDEIHPHCWTRSMPIHALRAPPA